MMHKNIKNVKLYWIITFNDICVVKCFGMISSFRALQLKSAIKYKQANYRKKCNDNIIC